MIAVLIGLVLTLIGSIAAIDNSMGIATKQTINFSEPTVVAGSLLPVGTYKVTHEMQGETHTMVFKQADGTVAAKASCKLVPLKGKAPISLQVFKNNAKNQRVLIEMTFSGDKATHVFEP